jgi:hypothetical protein
MHQINLMFTDIQKQQAIFVLHSSTNDNNSNEASLID